MTTTQAPGLLSTAAPGSAESVAYGPGVLLVDDEVAYLDLLEQLLGEHLSCAVHAFAKPAEALVALPSLKIALIVTDYNMPGLDGFEFLQAVARTRPELPAVMITAHDVELTPERRRRLPQLKAIIRKPFRWPVLANEILQHWPGSRPPFP
jgi:CheY-like chemotaxis protein